MPKTHHKTKGADLAAALDRTASDEREAGAISATADAIARFYGFERMRISPMESAASWALLARADLSDARQPVFCKMREGEEMVLCPSAALGMVRAYFSHHMQDLPHPLKIMTEAETYTVVPKKAVGRSGKKVSADMSAGDDAPYAARREWALAMMGEDSLVAEAEIIQIIWKTCAELGLTYDMAELRINVTGCQQCRAPFRSALGAYLRARASRLCAISRRDLKSRPARVLSCTDERCRGIAEAAPQTLDFLCEKCKKRLRTLLEFLDEARVPYFLDARMFGESAWLGEVIFMVVARQPSPDGDDERSGASDTGSGAPAVIAEGGRMSRAAHALGGRELPVVAGTVFLDAVAEELSRRSRGVTVSTDVFFIQLGELAKRKSLEILEALREAGVDVKESLGRDSIKIQFKIAERVGARYALVLGQKEALDTTIIVRETGSGIQETIPQDKLIDFLMKKIKK
jgi:histidyl-tRNA synthetase